VSIFALAKQYPGHIVVESNTYERKSSLNTLAHNTSRHLK